MKDYTMRISPEELQAQFEQAMNKMKHNETNLKLRENNAKAHEIIKELEQEVR